MTLPDIEIALERDLLPEIYIPGHLRTFQPLNIYNLDEELYFGSRLVIKPGMSVYDIGTYCGVITSYLAMLVGRRGRVVLFDASCEAVERARQVALSNKMMNVDFVQAVVQDIDQNDKDSRVRGISLDSYAQETGVIPELVKIDAVHSENFIIKGMESLLDEKKPAILIKLSCQDANIEKTNFDFIDNLFSLGYQIYDLEHAASVTKADVCRSRNLPFILCVFENTGSSFRKEIDLVARYIKLRQRQRSELAQARQLVNNYQYEQALPLLKELLVHRSSDAELNYLLALCLASHKYLDTDALQHFEMALEHGFEAFWVHYNRGIFYKNLGAYVKARMDLEKAVLQAPGQREVTYLLDQVIGEQINDNLQRVRLMVENGEHLEAIPLLKKTLADDPENAEANYLLAVCLQMTDGDSSLVFRHYAEALERGYDEFWVRYNRGALHLNRNDVDAALSDIVIAGTLKPDDSNVMAKLDEIKQVVLQKSRSCVNGVDIYVPGSFANILPVSPCHICFDYEPGTYFVMRSILHDDSVVFDVGSSYGVLSVLAAMQQNFHGCVAAFEANPEVINLAKTLAAANGIEDKIDFFNICVGEKSMAAVDFFTLSGFSSVASTRNPRILDEFTDAVKIKIPVLDLDTYCHQHNRFPDIIKIDVEGSEYLVLKGAKDIIGKYHPDLLIETHWHRIAETGGSLALLCDELASYGYSLFDLSVGKTITAQAYERCYSASIGYLFATTKSKPDELDGQFSQFYQSEMKQVKQRKDLWDSLEKVKQHIQTDHYSEALALLQPFLVQSDYAEAHYYAALCYQKGRRDWSTALLHYAEALKNGFDEFWVRYNRSFLFYDMDDIEKAYEDLTFIAEEYPDHQDALDFYQFVAVERAHRRIDQAQKAIDVRRYTDAIELLAFCLEVKATQTEANYLLAYCLQQMEGRERDALLYYQAALEQGYQPFWVYYHRGLMMMKLGDPVAAGADLKRAVELDPAHSDARKVYHDVCQKLGLENEWN